MGVLATLSIPTAILLIQASARKSGAREAPSVPLTEPRHMCNEPLDHACLPAETIVDCLASRKFEIVQGTSARGGTQSVRVLTIRCTPDSGMVAPIVLRAKWRDALGTLLNEPRRELIAYETQRLFLEPDEHVVPPVVARCLPIDVYEKFIGPREGMSEVVSTCGLGYLSFWLQDVELASTFSREQGEKGQLFIARRFSEDPLYARKVARLNLLTVFVRHGDSHPGQFLVARDPFRVFSVDHSISLTMAENPMVLLREDWSELIVPSIPKSLADRVRTIHREDVDALSVVARLDKHDKGMVQVSLKDVPRGGDFAYQADEGSVLIGATEAERDLIAEQIEVVKQALSDESLGVFGDDEPRPR